MSNERVTYAELNVSKHSRNQKRQPRGTRSSISVTEQEITYVELGFQNTSPEHPSVCRDCCCKGFPSPPEKPITVILGMVGFALMVAVVLIITVAKPYTEPKEQIQSSLNKSPKDNNHSSAQPCSSCPKEWMSYSHSCYYISGEKKNWTDSLVSCNAKNSSLLYIDSREEQVRVAVCQSLLNLFSCRYDVCGVDSNSYTCFMYLQLFIPFHCFILEHFIYICILIVNTYFQIVLI
ncbi:NKG2-A/NKG2-B type II integral membrane protein-like isoform X2 [Alexandromys fortis]|uniref:NKG2-A/NKG2-B type II integral membrane protein-like isoform X1 n=1 Tax=Alexandromys fortis TaxID=100897 RepID=UPI002152F4C3|nr:NKG2-A/NKG2-B type II integral membrane protein-like isoform X1 [Microtus fortis]XP_049988371.1 NKG2-A/NKG2-B type II integral membrane protein-like isoform X2 [Microtus fortis]